MGKAVNIMSSGGRAKNVPMTETPAVSTGNGGISTSLQIKSAATKPANIKNVTLDKQTSAGDKVNNLF